jgi:ABC-type Zn uptake system ZnuABC Zn-binding protein ZnuA
MLVTGRRTFCSAALAALALLFLVECPGVFAEEPIPVVVTIPVLKDLAEQVGGGRVRVTSLLTGLENEHTYSPKPSDLVAVRKARVLFEIGIGLEVWAASLVRNAGSPSLMVVTTSRDIELIHDRSGGHDRYRSGNKTEPGGNPHIWLDPVNVGTMLGHITDALIKVDPPHAAEFRTNQAAYLGRLNGLRHELTERLKPISDRRFIAHHPAWPYLARRFGLTVAGVIQTQSGAEPSARQLQGLITSMKRERIRVIASEVQLNQKLPQLLAQETGARVVVLTTLPGALPGTETYLDMLRYNVVQLAGALEGG